LAVAGEAVGLHRLVQNKALFGLSVPLIWIPIEGALLATWGYTPGKAFFRVRVRKGIDGRPRIEESLIRAFRVWWRGVGCGLPGVVLFTAWRAKIGFAILGTTSWDRDGQLTVLHGDVGVLRWCVFAALGIGAVAFATVT
jgi:hypothetical protein